MGEELKSELRDERTAVAKAERDAVAAEASAAERLQTTERIEADADAATKAAFASLQSHADKHNASLDALRTVHNSFVDMSKKNALMRKRLEETEREKVRLRLHLQQVAGG